MNLAIPKTIKLFIGGQFPRTESGRTFPVHRIKTKSVYAQICQASRKDFRNAVTAAQGAFSSWSGKSAYNRAQILYRMAEMMESKRTEFAEMMNLVLGLNSVKSNQEIDSAIAALIYYSGWADKYQQVVGAVNPVSGPHHNFTSAEPAGVVGLLVENNFKFSQFVSQIAAIISSGNTVVALMPSEGGVLLAPLAEVFATSDLTAGAINLLSGHTDELYKQFGSHLEMQSLACSVKDKKIQAELKVMAADNMKRVVLMNPDLNLESLISFVEFKTVWHPIGQ